MDSMDRKLLNEIQTEFPLVDTPFITLGESLGIEESEVITRLLELKRTNVVRQIGAIFDTRKLGYKTTLVAFAFPEDQLHDGAMYINEHPGVSHNYAREGSYYNLWFTIAVPPSHDLEETISVMYENTGATECRIMPTIKFFKIGVNFDMVNQKGLSHNYSPDGFNKTESLNNWNQAQVVTPEEQAVIRELQEDIEIISRPFDKMADNLNITTEQLYKKCYEFKERTLMRRFSAVLHHRRSGFMANAMVVWEVDESDAETIGMKMAEHPAVTHCYQRPTFPDWPYTHFTMIHATTKEECHDIADQIQEQSGISNRLMLYSTREYKKTRVRYFVDDYDRYRQEPNVAN
ncbi:MAG TPA: Lrp/AsnC family transcriptional regulator [Dehalococcoidia bacterium]|jgi:DNA-binding Lrp family transcriptional regulator|nr:Lrp/AsnC family transcriptional regulator [Dehalococcoidia bacterium]